KGFADADPIVPNNATGGTALNRRVELIVNYWTPLTDQFPSLAFNSIAISPLDADGHVASAVTPTNKLVIFAGTGSVSSFSQFNEETDYGVGILKSVDGGSTWTLN